LVGNLIKLKFSVATKAHSTLWKCIPEYTNKTFC